MKPALLFAALALGTPMANAQAFASSSDGPITFAMPDLQVAYVEGMAPAESYHASRNSNPLADDVRTANDRFRDVKEAISEGYAPIPCVSGPAGGAMGIHFVNGALLSDDAIDLAHPEAVMYEPQSDGSLKLVAVEYITYKGPANLEGHLFNFSGAPNRYGLGPYYSLHVWAWRRNPTGTFSDMNPKVSCDAATSSEPAATAN